jgi:hypothetical protein
VNQAHFLWCTPAYLKSSGPSVLEAAVDEQKEEEVDNKSDNDDDEDPLVVIEDKDEAQANFSGGRVGPAKWPLRRYWVRNGMQSSMQWNANN